MRKKIIKCRNRLTPLFDNLQNFRWSISKILNHLKCSSSQYIFLNFLVDRLVNVIYKKIWMKFESAVVNDEEKQINEQKRKTENHWIYKICRCYLLYHRKYTLGEEYQTKTKMSNRGYLEHIWFMWLLLDLLFYFAVTSPLNYWVKPMILIKLCCNELLGFVFSFCQAAE